MSALAVVGFGSGLGLLVKKVLQAKQQDGTWDWGGAERAAAAAAKRRAEEEERERDRKQMQQIIDKLDSLQTNITQVGRPFPKNMYSVESLCTYSCVRC